MPRNTYPLVDPLHEPARDAPASGLPSPGTRSFQCAGRLETLMRSCPAAVAAAVTDGHGQTLATAGNGDLRIEGLERELSSVLEQVSGTGDILALGALRELMIHGDRLLYLMHVTPGSELLCLALPPEMDPGEGWRQLEAGLARVDDPSMER